MTRQHVFINRHRLDMNDKYVLVVRMKMQKLLMIIVIVLMVGMIMVIVLEEIWYLQIRKTLILLMIQNPQKFQPE